jgi:hypothetical protein
VDAHRAQAAGHTAEPHDSQRAEATNRVGAMAEQHHLHVVMLGQSRELLSHHPWTADLLAQRRLSQDKSQARAVLRDGGLAFGPPTASSRWASEV